MNALTANVLFIGGGGGGWYFFFQSRLSGVTTKRARTKGKQHMLWAGARLQHKHMHTYTQKSCQNTQLCTQMNAHTHLHKHKWSQQVCRLPVYWTSKPFQLCLVRVTWNTHTLSLSHRAGLILSTQHGSLMVHLSSSAAPKCFSYFSEIREAQEASPPASQEDLFIITSKCT